MRNLFLFLLKILSKISLIFYPKYLVDKLNTLYRKFYTFRKAPEFKSFGNSIILGKFSLLKGANNINIANNVSIGKYVTLTAFEKRIISSQHFKPEINIGDGTVIGDFAHITSIDNITIGKNVLLGKNVLITDNSHGNFNDYDLKLEPMKRKVISKGVVFIDDNVWIGEKSSILSGVNIGKGSIIAANSVVIKDVPKYSIVAGVPAVIKKSLQESLRY